MLDAFIVGSLGAWDPENNHLLPKLEIGRKYGTCSRSCAVVTPLLVVTRSGLHGAGHKPHVAARTSSPLLEPPVETLKSYSVFTNPPRDWLLMPHLSEP